ncbi:MAG: hypothetical protein ACFFE4_09430 [Candidatus Thorarchaeota archaeon]
MSEKSKKHVTKYLTIENAIEKVNEKKYTAAPQAQFIRKETNSLRVLFYYSTTKNIPIYYAIFFSLIVSIPLIIIMSIVMGISMGLLYVLLFLNLLLYFPAIILRQIKKNKNLEFYFDKELNLFTKSKIKSNEDRELQFESKLLDIRQVEIRSTRFKQTVRHWIYLRLKDGKEINFFFISYHNPSQIVDYTTWLCNFLEVEPSFLSNYARKLFSGIV